MELLKPEPVISYGYVVVKRIVSHEPLGQLFSYAMKTEAYMMRHLRMIGQTVYEDPVGKVMQFSM